MRYRKKPIVVEAYRTDKEMVIHTLEGDMRASVGDYIITGVNGEQYPCKPDIFEKTYEQVKHGEWLPIVKQDSYLEPPYCDTIKCSECGQEADVSFHDAKYCFECGAIMSVNYESTKNESE